MIGDFTVLVCIIAVVLQVTEIDALTCYTCENVYSVASCNTVSPCPRGRVCHENYTTVGSTRLFTLGCMDPADCQTWSGGLLVGRAVSMTTCSECCHTGHCNRQLCQNDYPNCVDAFDNCETAFFFTNICSDIQTAKNTCRRFCGLCGPAATWSQWSTWSICSVTCANGTRTRTRTCSNPASSNGGTYCVGDSTETGPCETGVGRPVDGGWTNWLRWDGCSATCDIATTRRERKCSNPTPAHGGEHCHGYSFDTKICYLQPCQDGSWTAWGEWDTCPVTCGAGVTTRSRTCTNPAPSLTGKSCVGNSMDTKICLPKACQADGSWSQWSTWSSCTVTCANGTRTRTRPCSNPAPSNGGKYCVGDSTESESCGIGGCPADGFWSQWSTWSSCTVTCANGTRTRTRPCSNPAPSNGGKYCVGDSTESESCGIGGCPVNGGWTNWARWDACSAECDIATSRRMRRCSHPTPAYGGEICHGYSFETKICYLQPCQNGSWTDWSDWGTCSVTCDGGVKTRSRTCTNPAPSIAGRYCVGDSIEAFSCNVEPCVGRFAFEAHNVINVPTIGQRLMYSTATVNIGNYYSNTTGVFTAPVNGTYQFSVQLCVNDNEEVGVSIVVHGRVIAKVATGNPAMAGTCTTGNGIAPMSNGGTAWVTYDMGNAHGIKQDNFRWNTFSGVLIGM